MQYNRDLFIFGKPITTNMGIVRFLTYEEFLHMQSELSLMGMNILHIYYYYREQIPKQETEKLEELKELKEVSLFEYVNNDIQFKKTYEKIFNLVIDYHNGFDSSYLFNNEQAFILMRKLIMDMNIIIEEDVSPNEEIQKGIERSRRLKQNNSEKQSFVDIVTCIVAETPNDYEKVYKMNVIQVYALYARLNAIHNYKTTTLFATVAEKVNIELWNKHIDLFEKKSDTLTRAEFDKSFGGLLN